MNTRTPLSSEEYVKFQGYMNEIFCRVGMIQSKETQDTPKRWLQALLDMTDGYNLDPKINTIFPRECVSCEEGAAGVQIVEGPISFISLCEHHSLPFVGHAYIGYLRKENIIGISKFTRIVRMYSRRFSVQERMAQEIANELQNILSPYGVITYLEAHHTCTQARGVREMDALTRTLEKRGEYAKNPMLVSEFMDIAGLRRSRA